MGARRGRRAGVPACGFGLVELMVALALGLVVVGAAAMLFSGTIVAGHTSDNLSRMAESVRTSYDLMVREVREAGASPCDAQVLTANVLTQAQGAAPAWWATWGEPLRGFDGAADFDGAAFGGGVGERVAGTQAVVVRYGQTLDGVRVSAHNPAGAVFTVNPANHGVAVGDLVMVCSYRQQAIFTATAANPVAGTFTHAAGLGTPSNCTSKLGLPVDCVGGTTLQFTPGSLAARFVAAGWYIGNNGRPETGGRSLYRVTRGGAEEVAEGVRDMQLAFLPAGGGDYVTAAAVTDWSAVLAVRVDLTYETHDASTSTAAAGQRLQRTVTFVANVRNLMP
ncbi:MAG: prepilin-type N-terminal cleavage/methylation domain-containing protein [Rubrivivax sp.]|nr:prepilin-type N-terminal cleavage/methylation domain-containing protein [Rubrivivax sp.]